jgi:hypothetical protein
VVSTNVLKDTFGIKGSGDRPLITMLKTLGFLDQSGRPTNQYDLLKNPAQARRAIAVSVRKAYAPLFDANENAHELSSEELRGLVAQVAGADKGIASKISGTFNSLTKLGDFSDSQDTEEDVESEDAGGDESEEDGYTENERKQKKQRGGLRPEFHYNIQIHVPANGSEETYLNIFNAIRKTFK